MGVIVVIASSARVFTTPAIRLVRIRDPVDAPQARYGAALMIVTKLSRPTEWSICVCSGRIHGP
jgi:hypothetical protein